MLCSDLRISKENRAVIVDSITKGRSSSAGNLTFQEAIDVIKYLENMQKEKKVDNSPENKMRRKILSICYEMQWSENGKIDWKRLNGWLLKYGYLKKPLNDYTYQELPKLITQFEQLLKDYYAKR